MFMGLEWGPCGPHLLTLAIIGTLEMDLSLVEITSILVDCSNDRTVDEYIRFDQLAGKTELLWLELRTVGLTISLSSLLGS